MQTDPSSAPPVRFELSLITVSGQPSVKAVAGYYGAHLIATAVHTADLLGLHARQERAAASVTGTPSEWARCAGCNGWYPRAALAGAELGVAADEKLQITWIIEQPAAPKLAEDEAGAANGSER